MHIYAVHTYMYYVLMHVCMYASMYVHAVAGKFSLLLRKAKL